MVRVGSIFAWWEKAACSIDGEVGVDTSPWDTGAVKTREAQAVESSFIFVGVGEKGRIFCCVVGHFVPQSSFH